MKISLQICALLAAWAVTTAICQADYPDRPLRIVTAEAGGGSDFTARLIAQGLSISFAQPVIVDNRGGSVVIPADIVAKAPADGYTLLANGCTVWISQLLLLGKKPPDALRDFAPVTVAITSPSVLVVHPTSPIASVKDLIAIAKGKPGELNYSSGPRGSSAYNAAELFKSMTGVDIVQVNYKGTAQALNGVLTRETHLMVANAAGAAPLVSSGRLRAIAVASSAPSALFPGIPTVTASGGPANYESGSALGIFVPAQTPKVITNKLYRDIARTLNAADVKKKLLVAGVEPVASTPDELANFMTSEALRMARIIKEARAGEN